jgi:hypothetical protein
MPLSIQTDANNFGEKSLYPTDLSLAEIFL